jgi:hypothetical protein
MVTLWCRCIPDGKFQQAMGMAIECRRLDKLEEANAQCDKIHETLSYCINISHPLKAVDNDFLKQIMSSN